MESTLSNSSKSTELSIDTIPEELLESVRKQMEFYFSKENLMTDSFLVSQMDINKSVPISVVMKVSGIYNSYISNW